ncbi:MAG: TRAP transporter small permease subunit, partial [Saprospiraceae bacterium]|nr:TRAP transporter small permease subunit [Saprospiraceae bacterium]
MRQKIDKVLEHILVALMAINTLDVLWGVFTRYVMGAQASWSEELARFLLIWIGILGAAWASGKNMHL